MQAKASTQRGQGQGQAAMKMKTGNKKMRGFMCQSPAATAVCMSSGDPRSVIVPRRPDRTVQLDHSNKFMNNAKYSRLVESRRFLPVHNKRSLIISPLPIKRDPDPAAAHQKPSPLHNSSLLTTPLDQVFQVVVMRVSLHCQGCAGKVKKHLSKMEGVTSFSIDLETKRVTVMGHVSPAGVVESISKVKKAELWPCN